MTCGFILLVPDGMHNTNMDNILADSLPLLTMLACVPVLRMFVRQRNHMDLVRSGHIAATLSRISSVCTTHAIVHCEKSRYMRPACAIWLMMQALYWAGLMLACVCRAWHITEADTSQNVPTCHSEAIL